MSQHSPSPQTIVDAVKLSSSLQEVLGSLAKKKSIRHAVLGVEIGDGSFSWADATGAADDSGRSMTRDTPYFIASVTKLFVAAVVLRLVERGEVRLECPVP